MTEKIENVYQFKITLKDTKPKIWRRIQVPENYDFNELHVAIQCAMGWKNYHLHDFRAFNIHIGVPDKNEFSDSLIDEKTMKISEYFTAPKTKITYSYDFGDDWEHTVLLEKILPAVPGASYPQCLAGKMKCPPEDCGGTDGYEELKDIQSNSDHPEHEEQKAWLGDDFDPTEFDPKTVLFCPPSHFAHERVFDASARSQCREGCLRNGRIQN